MGMLEIRDQKPRDVIMELVVHLIEEGKEDAAAKLHLAYLYFEDADFRARLQAFMAEKEQGRGKV